MFYLFFFQQPEDYFYKINIHSNFQKPTKRWYDQNTLKIFDSSYLQTYKLISGLRSHLGIITWKKLKNTFEILRSPRDSLNLNFSHHFCLKTLTLCIHLKILVHPHLLWKRFTKVLKTYNLFIHTHIYDILKILDFSCVRMGVCYQRGFSCLMLYERFKISVV